MNIGMDHAVHASDDSLLLTGSAARILGVAADTVRHLERVGRLSALKTTTGVRLFRLSDILAERQRRTKP